MKTTNEPSSKSLHPKAEEVLKSRHSSTDMPLSDSETAELIQEHQLSQIELELQNQELLNARKLAGINENEEEYRNMFTCNPQPMWIFDQETMAFLEVNDAAIHHYGYSRDEFLSMTIKDIRPEEDIESMVQEVERTQKTYNPAKEWRHQKKNGDLIYVEIISHPMSYNGREARHVMINDITRRKLTEEALRKSEERSRNALDHLLEGCQIIGFDWKYIYLNHTAEIHNKRPKEELLGQRYMDMWPGIEETEVFKVIKQTLETRVPAHLDNKFFFPDGSLGWFDLSIQPVPEGVFILSIDITERKNVESALQRSEEKYRLIADNSDDWIYWIAPDGYVNYVSPACERVTDYSPEEFSNHPELNHEIVFEADKKKVSHHTRISKLDDTPHNLEFRIVTKSGEIRWINHSCSPIFNDSGEYMGRRGTNRNITERKLQEEQLYESEFRFSKLYENGPFGMVMADKEFRFKKANPAFCEIMGYSEAELLQFTFKDVSHSDDLPKDMDNVRKLMNKEISVYKTEKRYIRKDGQVIWGSLTVTPTYDSEAHFLYFLGIIEDITIRKQAEEALRERENKLSTLLNLLPVGVSILDENQKIVYENQALENILGITREGMERGDYRERKYLRSDETPKPAREFASVRAFSEKTALHNVITGIVKENGQTIWTNVSAVPVDFPDWKVVLVTADITNLKLAEKALKKSEQLLSETESMGKVGGWEFNIDTMEQTWTEEVYRIHEVDSNFNPNVNTGINFYTPSSRPVIEKAVQRVIEFGEPFDLELEIITAKGNLRKVHSIGKADFENRRIYGFFQDITDRKRAEEEIQKLNERISTATRASQVGIWDWDIKSNVLVWDDQMYALYGVKKNEFAGAYEAWVAGLHPDDKEHGTTQTQLALKGEKEYDTEFRVVWPDGTVRHCKAKGEVFRNEYGEPIRMVGVNYDITERKQIENALKESEEYLKLGYDTADLGIWKNDLNMMTVEFDERARSHYGFEESVVTLSDVIARVHPDDVGRLAAEIEKATAPTGTGRYSTEYRVIHPDGSVYWLYVGVRVMFEGEGETRRSIMGFGTSMDITERKQNEEKVRQKDQEFRKLSSNVPDLIYQFTRKPDGTYFVPIASEGIRNIFGCAPEDVLDDFSPIGRVIYPEDAERVIRDIEYSAAHLTYFTCEFRVQIPGKEIQWIYSKSTPERLPDGSITWYGFNTDITQKKLAEETLKLSEERYRNIFESAVIGIYRTTPDGQILMANPTLIKMLGFESFQELAQRNLKSEGYEDIKKRREFQKKIGRNGSVIGLESVWITKDGRSVIVSENAKAFYDSNNQVIYYEGTIEDITERKQIEKTLKESEEKFRQAFSTNPDAITITRLSDGVYVSVNNGFTQVFGYPEEEVLGKTSIEISMWCNPEDRKIFVNELKAKGIVENFEARLYTKSGKIKDTLVSSTILDFEGQPHILSTTKDITERKLAEKALRESEEKFRQLIESIPLPVTYVSSEGEIAFRNDRFIQVIGYTHNEVPTVDTWWVKAYPDEEYRKWVIRNWESAMEHAIKTNTDILPKEYRITCKDGVERIFVVSGIIIDNNLLITFIDITDRKKAEDEIRKLNETLEERVEERTSQLQEANNELEAFSYSVSHDLRAPLRHINGFVDLLTENYTGLLPEKGQHYLEIIANSSRHMGTLIDDLLQFSRTGRKEMQQIDLDMNVVLREVLNLTKQDARDRKIEWNISELPVLTGDQALLRMAWYNLLSNAIKFTKAKKPAIIQIGHYEEKNEYVFFVRDNGAGFDMRYAHKLFGVFQRLHTTKEFEGTGIGLANVRRIIIKHGGRTWAESQLNQGATFYFTLPKPK